MSYVQASKVSRSLLLKSRCNFKRYYASVSPKSKSYLKYYFVGGCVFVSCSLVGVYQLAESNSEAKKVLVNLHIYDRSGRPPLVDDFKIYYNDIIDKVPGVSNVYRDAKSKILSYAPTTWPSSEPHPPSPTQSPPTKSIVQKSIEQSITAVKPCREDVSRAREEGSIVDAVTETASAKTKQVLDLSSSVYDTVVENVSEAKNFLVENMSTAKDYVTDTGQKAGETIRSVIPDVSALKNVIVSNVPPIPGISSPSSHNEEAEGEKQTVDVSEKSIVELRPAEVQKQKEISCPKLSSNEEIVVKPLNSQIEKQEETLTLKQKKELDSFNFEQHTPGKENQDSNNAIDGLENSLENYINVEKEALPLIGAAEETLMTYIDAVKGVFTADNRKESWTALVNFYDTKRELESLTVQAIELADERYLEFINAITVARNDATAYSSEMMDELELKGKAIFNETHQVKEKLNQLQKDLVNEYHNLAAQLDINVNQPPTDLASVADVEPYLMEHISTVLNQNDSEELLGVRNTLDNLQEKHNQQLLEIRTRNRDELQTQLQNLTAAHQLNMTEELTRQKNELESEMLKSMITQRDTLSAQYHNEIKRAVDKLGDLEKEFSNRIQIEKMSLMSHELVLACHQLESNILVGNLCEDFDNSDLEKKKALDWDIRKLYMISRGDTFIDKVLQYIPEEALRDGVASDESLRVRVFDVSRHARKVVGVDELHNSLWHYFISYVKGLASVRSHNAERLPSNIEPQFATQYELLDLAEFCAKEGELELALRLLNQLTGEPRYVAQGWLHDARIHLETLQLAKVLSSHAASISCAMLGNQGEKVKLETE